MNYQLDTSMHTSSTYTVTMLFYSPKHPYQLIKKPVYYGKTLDEVRELREFYEKSKNNGLDAFMALPEEVHAMDKIFAPWYRLFSSDRSNISSTDIFSL